MREHGARAGEATGLAMLWTDALNAMAMDESPMADSPAADPRTARGVVALAPPREGSATGICRNLAATADAFARLTDAELFALPDELRLHAREALVGVCQILDLVHRMDELGLRPQARSVAPDLPCGIDATDPFDLAPALLGLRRGEDIGGPARSSTRPETRSVASARNAPGRRHDLRSLWLRVFPKLEPGE
jgi:hypothetical protein